MNDPPDLDLPALVALLQDLAAQLRAADQHPMQWRAGRPPIWGVQRAQDPARNCAACGLPLAIGQPYWIGAEDGGRVTHTGLAACARVAFALLGLAGSHWGLLE